MSRFPNIEETVSPGPWNYNVGPGEDDVNGERIVVTDKHYNQVANVFPWAHHGEANARLIAAAPELLEALEELYAQAKDWPGFGPSYHLTKAFEAIAKAKGE